MRSHPFNLGLLLLTMFLLAFVLNTLCDRQSWCRYLCPLGGMNGLLARTSLIELRADSALCLSRCSTHECYYGTQRTEGCAFNQVVATLHSNQFCKICGNCAKNCPHDAVALNLRAPGRELAEVRHVRTGTGFLVLALAGALMSDMLTKVPWYGQIEAWLPGSKVVSFTALYAGSIVAPNLLCLAAAALSHQVFRERLTENYSRFALSVLPLTCMGFLAFHLHYVLSLGPQIFSLLGQHFGIVALSGVNPAVSRHLIVGVQQGLIGTGLVWTLLVMYRLGMASARGRRLGRWGIIPHAVVAVVIAGALVAGMKEAFKEWLPAFGA